MTGEASEDEKKRAKRREEKSRKSEEMSLDNQFEPPAVGTPKERVSSLSLGVGR